MPLHADFVYAYIFEELKPELSPYGFELIATKQQFRKVVKTGFESIVFSVAEYEDLCIVDCHLGVHNYAIEELVNPYVLSTSPMDMHKDSFTLIIPFGKFQGRPNWRMKVKHIDDLDHVVRSYLQFLWSHGMIFLETHLSLQAIDSVLNDHPSEPSNFLHNQIYRCFKGLAVSYLNQSPAMDSLWRTYQNALNHLPGGTVYLSAFSELYQKIKGFD